MRTSSGGGSKLVDRLIIGVTTTNQQGPHVHRRGAVEHERREVRDGLGNVEVVGFDAC